MDELFRIGFVEFPPVSPFVKHNGPIFVRLTAEGRLEYAIKVSASHANPTGACHGGMLTTLLDSAMGGVGIYELAPQKIAPTISLTCNFMRPAFLDEVLIARAQVHRSTNSHLFVSCVLNSAEGAIATASGVYLIPQQETLGFDMRKIINGLCKSEIQ